MCSALLLAGCNKTSQQDQTVSKEQKSTAQKPPNSETVVAQIMVAMHTINQNSKIEDLNQINEKLKTCVPSLKNEEQLKLIDASTTMYQRFLKQDYTEKTARAFEAFGYAVLEKNRDLKRSYKARKIIRSTESA
jgi:hypothetical protein